MSFADREHKQVLVCRKRKREETKRANEERERERDDGTRIIILIISISSYGTEKRVISSPHYPVARNPNRNRTSHN